MKRHGASIAVEKRANVIVTDGLGRWRACSASAHWSPTIGPDFIRLARRASANFGAQAQQSPRSVNSAVTGYSYSLSAPKCRYMAAVQENAEPPSGSPVSGLKYSAKPARSTSARLSTDPSG